MEREVLNAEATATNCVRLFLRLFAAHAEGQSVNQPHGCGLLLEMSVFRLQVLAIITSDTINTSLQLHRFLEFAKVHGNYYGSSFAAIEKVALAVGASY